MSFDELGRERDKPWPDEWFYQELHECTWCLETKKCLLNYWPYECQACQISGKINRGAIGCLALPEAKKAYEKKFPGFFSRDIFAVFAAQKPHCGTCTCD